MTTFEFLGATETREYDEPVCGFRIVSAWRWCSVCVSREATERSYFRRTLEAQRIASAARGFPIVGCKRLLGLCTGIKHRDDLIDDETQRNYLNQDQKARNWIP